KLDPNVPTVEETIARDRDLLIINPDPFPLGPNRHCKPVEIWPVKSAPVLQGGVQAAGAAAQPVRRVVGRSACSQRRGVPPALARGARLLVQGTRCARGVARRGWPAQPVERPDRGWRCLPEVVGAN